MKKAIYFSCALLLCSLATAGCGSHSNPESSTASTVEYSEDFLSGTWNGAGYAIGQDENYNADYLQLTFSDDNSYELRDQGTDTQIMSGDFTLNKDNSLSITNQAATDSPLLGWDDMEEKAKLSYTILNDTTIALSYDDICYVFEKDGQDEQDGQGGDSFSLLDQSVGDIWYSNDGIPSSEETYELNISDHFFQLYSLTDNQEPKLLTSFIYQNHQDDAYTFYTYKDPQDDFSSIFKYLPDGFSSVNLTMTFNDNSLVLEYDGQKLSFSSDVIYGLETGSDAYALCDTSFQWAFDSENHFCYFTMNPGTDTLYLYMTNTASAEEATATVCGEIDIDQQKQVITYHFDEEESQSSSDSSEAIYKKCKELDGQKLNYTIQDKTLQLTIDGDSYSFPLEDY